MTSHVKDPMNAHSPLMDLVQATLPVMFGYVPMGMAFGFLLVDQGYAWYWATLMGIVIFAGAAQFMAIGLLGAQAGLMEVSMTTLLLNSRHVFYGLSLIHRLKARGWRKFYIIFGLTDETYSLLTARQARNSGLGQSTSLEEETRFQFGITLLNHSYWVSGCTLGAWLGGAVHFDTVGLEFTLPALFMVLVIEQYQSTRRWFPFVIASVCAVSALVFFDSGSMLLVSILLSLALLLGGQQLQARGYWK